MGYKKTNKVSETPKSKYKGVQAFINQNRQICWQATKQHNGKTYKKNYPTEREAAVSYDKMCLSFGLEPVNILKRK